MEQLRFQPFSDVFPDGIVAAAESDIRAVRRLTDDLVTQILDNNLHELEELRRGIERAQRKDVEDVREFDTIGSALLRGVESPVSYFDLVDLITDLRQGLARRRTA